MAETQREFTLSPAVRAAQQRGAIAAQACADAAERRSPGWTDAAHAAFVAYARAYPDREFTTEDVRLVAKDVADAPDPRAWGAVAQRAKREGVVIPCGWRPVASSNGSPKTVWKLNPVKK